MPPLLPRLVPSPVRRVRRYREVTGRFPPLLRPRTFNEKLNWRICFDRRALLAHTCDKLAMKEHARRRGPSGLRIPRTLWAGTDVAGLAGVELPAHWVLKPVHSCRRVLVGSGAADPADLAARTAGWVEERYWRLSEEWAYRRARPGLLVEEFVGVPGQVPVDLKVLVLDGVPRVVEVHTARGPDHRIRFRTPDWEPLPWTAGYRCGPDTAPPDRLADMLAAAAALAAGYDMLRVDFYEHAGQLWFGELTPYPGAGWTRLEPEFDELLGSWWTLPWHRRRAPVLPLPQGDDLPEERAAA
ncbi:ATP-grasp fold amidoligase family protein [Geodermatophilus sp. SYSU D01105]